MRIGIDARMYGPKQGGLGRYIQQLIFHLEEIDTQNEYIIFLRTQNFNEYTPKNPKFTKILADIPWYGWKEQLLLPKILKQAEVNLMHFPHWNAPLFYNQPFVVTVHDLLLLHYPTPRASTLSPVFYWLKNLAFKIILRHAVKQANHIITVSEFSKQDIAATLTVPLEKITNARQAPVYLPQTKTDTQQNEILKKYHLLKPYILYVGVAYPHKNLKALAEAFNIFSKTAAMPCQLALCGEKNYFYRRLEQYLKEQRIQNVSILGFVPDEELSTLYQHADLYAFASLYEGFGLPPLEAMQYNLPICASNIPCLTEILGDAAIYFNPKDHHDIARALLRALTDQTLRTELKNLGQNRLKNYSWESTASQILNIYQKQ